MQDVHNAKNNAEPGPNRVARLLSLAKTGERSIRLRLAANRTMPGEVLTLLSTDADEQVRLLVAKNTSTPHHVVAKLARDTSAAVRLGLASDNHCPVEILGELAEDEEPRVREAARNTRRGLLPTYQHIFNVAFS